MFRIRSNEIKQINTFLNKIKSNQFGTGTGTIWNPDRHSTSQAAGLLVQHTGWNPTTVLQAPDGPDR